MWDRFFPQWANIGITRSCMRWYVRKFFLKYQRIQDRVIPMLACCRSLSAPHRYSCEISVTNKRYATQGLMLLRDNLHMTFLAHDCILAKTKDVEAFRKIFNVKISTIKVGRHTWYKLNLCILLWTFIPCFVHIECKCDWHVLMCCAMTDWLHWTLLILKKKLIFPQQTYLLLLIWLSL